MLRYLQHPSGESIAPRAIFARPIQYFTPVTYSFEDGLEPFEGAFFREGNGLYFELRAYVSHPAGTVTLYLELALGEEAILPAVKHVADIFKLPWTAVVWHFGEDVNQTRPLIEDRSRLREKEARLLVLKIASIAKDRTADMQTIRDGITRLYPLSRADRQRSPSRKAEQLWQQIIRNVVSHRGGGKSIFVNGLAEKVGNGIRITKEGLAHLKSAGFGS